MENKELWGIGRTFLLALVGLIMGYSLIVMGHLPASDFQTMLLTCVAIYAGKSGIHAFANKKGDKSQ